MTKNGTHSVTVAPGDLLDWIVTPSVALIVSGNISISVRTLGQ